MNQVTALLGLLTETSLHAGAGSSVGAIDLPIQREGHNGWPCVFGSAVKGALRDRAETFGLDAEVIASVFGPDTRNASDNAGALAVGDARLLLLPVRSLTTAFKWVTCPEALARLQRDTKRLGLASSFDFEIPPVEGTNAMVQAPVGEHLFLEEYRLTPTPAVNLEIVTLASQLAQLMRRPEAEAELTRRLVIVGDDLFSHLAQSATPVNAHIALDSATKTVADHALWYEETLPPETLLYVPLVAVKARRKGSPLDASAIRDAISGMFAQHGWLQLGGNETVGMGWCAVTVLEG